MHVVTSSNSTLNRENSNDCLKGSRASCHVLENIENTNINASDILDNIDLNFPNTYNGKRRRIQHDYRKLSSSGRFSNNDQISKFQNLSNIKNTIDQQFDHQIDSYDNSYIPMLHGNFVEVSYNYFYIVYNKLLLITSNYDSFVINNYIYYNS